MAAREIERIVTELNRLYTDNWPEADFQGVLYGATDDTVNRQLPIFSNTIHQIARHLLGTDRMVTERLRGVEYQLSADENWPPTESLRDTPWSDTVAELLRRREELVAEVSKLSEDVLDRPILAGYSTVYATLHGHIQHVYYHTGQMVVVKKAVERMSLE